MPRTPNWPKIGWKEPREGSIYREVAEAVVVVVKVGKSEDGWVVEGSGPRKKIESSAGGKDWIELQIETWLGECTSCFVVEEFGWSFVVSASEDYQPVVSACSPLQQRQQQPAVVAVPAVLVVSVSTAGIGPVVIV